MFHELIEPVHHFVYHASSVFFELSLLIFGETVVSIHHELLGLMKVVLDRLMIFLFHGLGEGEHPIVDGLLFFVVFFLNLIPGRSESVMLR